MVRDPSPTMRILFSPRRVFALSSKVRVLVCVPPNQACGEPKHAKPDSSGYFKNLDLLGNAPERALLRGRGDAV